MNAISKPGARRTLHGVLLLDKPGGGTSNQALQRAKRLFGAAKAGHAGSLDPLATGMLPVCFGEATKLTTFMLGGAKTYRVTARLGIATDTGDADGRIVAQTTVPVLSEDALRQVLASFTGDIAQVPPMYSALKHEGTRLYALARRGIDVVRQPRTVSIHELSLQRHGEAELELRVRCSKGTYIRTLVEDLARALGCAAHVSALRRLAVAPFGERRMMTFDELQAIRDAGPEELDAVLLPVDSPIEGWPVLTVAEAQADRLAHGQAVAAEPTWPRGRVRLYSGTGQFFGIGEISSDGQLLPRRMFPGLVCISQRDSG